jgi:putative flippase GtrA
MKNKQQLLRFAAVGGMNTALDFGILFILKALGLPVITANIASTSIAFCFSFFANKKYTFKTTDTNIKREIILFVAVTLFGLWVLQSLVISLVSSLLHGWSLPDNLVLLIAKLVATVVSLIWNYALYSTVVFKQSEQDR